MAATAGKQVQNVAGGQGEPVPLLAIWTCLRKRASTVFFICHEGLRKDEEAGGPPTRYRSSCTSGHRSSRILPATHSL
ncbi:hypothetical protein [Arthrobacter sp. DR-2P]|nr:hypothetical protein [Arthrobacter sp. DR-2P]